jgi:hypothetical protein
MRRKGGDEKEGGRREGRGETRRGRPNGTHGVENLEEYVVVNETSVHGKDAHHGTNWIISMSCVGPSAMNVLRPT